MLSIDSNLCKFFLYTYLYASYKYANFKYILLNNRNVEKKCIETNFTH